MPRTKKQQVMARIAKHHPEKLFKRNKGMLKMSPDELHKFATGKIKKPADNWWSKNKVKKYRRKKGQEEVEKVRKHHELRQRMKKEFKEK